MLGACEPLESCAFPLTRTLVTSVMLEAAGRGGLETQKRIESKVWQVWAAGAGTVRGKGEDKQEYNWRAQRLVPAL